MSWQIKTDSDVTVVRLGSEMGIQNAADFHQAVLPLAVSGAPLRMDAQAAKSVHTSILQILYALSQAVPDFRVTNASDDFRATETRLGFSLARCESTKLSNNPAAPV
jgi:anti-anti-sigma regulatory factor